MAADIVHHTESVCPECLQKISARLVQVGQTIVLEKQCPEHGHFETIVWRGTPSFDSWSRPKIPYRGGLRLSVGKGCPFDCGLCRDHTQRTCTALVEITSGCNLNCPVCFADSTISAAEPDLDLLRKMFETIMEQTGGCNLQLSGGEPTIRRDLVEIVALAASVGFTFIQLNSNGLLLADDPELAGRLREAGLSSVFLQFDGVDDETYMVLRGRKLLEKKCRSIDNIGAAGIGVVLVPTIVRGVNNASLWDIVRFGLEHQPYVRGVHFQPMSYFGRFPKHFKPQHVTLPEVMHGLARQSDGVLHDNDFQPPGCEHALCSFSAKYLVEEDGNLRRLGTKTCDCSPHPAEEGALQSIGVTARQWGPVAEQEEGLELQDELSRFLSRARTHTFSISGMAFQDCWTLNLERLQGCCIHVAQPDGRLIPFCSFNLTARNGRSLHRTQAKREKFHGIVQETTCPKTSVDSHVGKRLGFTHHFSHEDIEFGQMSKLRKALRYAVKQAPFYRQHYGDLESRSVTFMD